MEFSCDFRNCIHTLGKPPSNRLYCCIVKSSKKTQLQDDAFTGKHKQDKSNQDVKSLEFSDFTLDFVPKDLCKTFPNLEALKFSNCGLKQISQQDFKGLESLVKIYIVACKLTTLPDDLLTKLPKLLYIAFPYNNIKFASSKLLEPLIGRQNVRIDLSGNKAIDASFGTGFDPLESLEELMEMIDEKCKKPRASPQAPDNIVDLTSSAADQNKSMGQVRPGRSADQTSGNSHESVVNSQVRGGNGKRSSATKDKEVWTPGHYDVTLIAGTKVFKAHKSLLRSKSSVFCKNFEDKNEGMTITLNDFSAIAVEAMMHFVYYGKVLLDGNAGENFAIAHHFKIERMKIAYEEIICNQLDNSNAYDIFTLAHRTAAGNLKKKAVAIIAKMFPDPIPEHVLEDSEKMKKLIAIRRDYEMILKE